LDEHVKSSQTILNATAIYQSKTPPIENIATGSTY